MDVHGMNYAAGVYGGPDFYGEFLNKEGHEHLSVIRVNQVRR